MECVEFDKCRSGNWLYKWTKHVLRERKLLTNLLAKTLARNDDTLAEGHPT